MRKLVLLSRLILQIDLNKLSRGKHKWQCFAGNQLMSIGTASSMELVITLSCSSDTLHCPCRGL